MRLRPAIRTLALALAMNAAAASLHAQASAARPAIRLLVRADDMGAAQAVDSATIDAYRRGVVRSAEVIVTGPWFLDAVRLIKANPGLDVGVHLALTSEWERVKWRPLTNAPSLVDADGYFRPMTAQRANFPPNSGFLDAGTGPKLDEVERELRAQIEMARRHFGTRLTHVSSHMYASRATPALDSLTRRLAREYGLLMEDAGGLRDAGDFGPNTLTNAGRAKALAALVDTLKPGTWLLVEHAAYDTPETRNIFHKGYENVATDRAGVAYAFTSDVVKAAVARRGVQLVSYADLASTTVRSGPVVEVPQGMGTPQYVGSINGQPYFSLVDSGPVARAQAALAADPTNRDKVIALGTAQAGARMMREAIETFTRGLAAHPDDALLLRWRGHRNLSVRNFAKAKTDLDRAARIDSTIYGIWYHEGVLRYVQGDFAGAAAAFRHALRAGPPDGGELAGSVDWLWMSLMRAGRTADAKALLASRPDTVPTTVAYKQRLSLYRGEITPEQLFTPGDTSDVNIATLSYGLGNWYLLKGDTTNAKKQFERSIASGGWPAFGFIASEAELTRMKRR